MISRRTLGLFGLGVTLSPNLLLVQTSKTNVMDLSEGPTYRNGAYINKEHMTLYSTIVVPASAAIFSTKESKFIKAEHKRVTDYMEKMGYVSLEGRTDPDPETMGRIMGDTVYSLYKKDPGTTQLWYFTEMIKLKTQI